MVIVKYHLTYCPEFHDSDNQAGVINNKHEAFL